MTAGAVRIFFGDGAVRGSGAALAGFATASLGFATAGFVAATATGAVFTGAAFFRPPAAAARAAACSSLGGGAGPASYVTGANRWRAGRDTIIVLAGAARAPARADRRSGR